ncbi:fluoride efflux transporter CrcB [Streptomyces sp. NPDC020472]|uniref:fluoride efflux transporter CrcB n=1 Tax=unclassified Streptomyces TaxID=2593676 RepID=UPI0036A3691A
MNWLLVVAGAAVGAPLRYLTDRAVQARHDSVFPWGTFTVNVVGSFVLGLLTGVASAQAQLLLGTGLCGALTTYSTFSYETFRLYENGAKGYAVLNATGSLAAGLGAVWLGVETAAGLR